MSRTPSGSQNWSQETVSPRSFLRRHPLPQIVRIHESCVECASPIPAKLDLSQPILLYQAYTCRKILAYSLDKDEKDGLKVLQPPLVIPDSYPGWMSTITEDGHTAGYFTSVEQVARSQVPFFLLKDGVLAYRLVENHRGNVTCSSIYEKITVNAGQVLQFLGVYEDKNLPIAANKRNRHRYAKCFCHREGVMYLPFNTGGKFYAVSRNQNHSVNHVFLVSTLIRSCTKLPMTVRIVTGPTPEVPFHFTGVLKLEEIIEQNVILGCTFSGKKPVLLEIDVDSDFTFRRALDDHRFKQTKHFCRMLQYCLDEGEKWRRQIKVAYHVIPQTPKERRWHKSSLGSSSSRSAWLPQMPHPRSFCIATNYDDGDSAMRSNTINSASSKGSSFTSKSSNFFSRFWNLHRPKFSMRSKKRDNYSATESVSEFSYCGHLYETVNNSELKQNRRDACYLPRMEFGDDGYGTGQMDGDDSMYDSVN